MEINTKMKLKIKILKTSLKIYFFRFKHTLIIILGIPAIIVFSLLISIGSLFSERIRSFAYKLVSNHYSFYLKYIYDIVWITYIFLLLIMLIFKYAASRNL